MFNQELADQIVACLNSAFPDKTQLNDLTKALPQFSSLPEQDWLQALDALQQEGRIDFKGLRTGMANVLQMAANIVITAAERRRIMHSPAPSVQVLPMAILADPEKARRVWVVHGRNDALNSAMFMFLLSLGLKPMSFSKARELTGKATPHISEVLDAAFRHAQAVVVLLTADDEGRLRPEFVKPGDEPSDTNLTPQPRLNVIFEAGMASISHPDQTVFVRFGYVRPFSDVAGLHYVSMGDGAEERRELALRLRDAGCPIDITDVHWLRAGDFSIADRKPRAERNRDSQLVNELRAYLSTLHLEWESQMKQRPVVLGPFWDIVNEACPILLDFHTRALGEGTNDVANEVAQAYQALKQYEGMAGRATMDFDDLGFFKDVRDAIDRLRSAVTPESRNK